MRLYAQHGYGPGEKLLLGLSQGVIDGVVLGAKDVPIAQVEAQITALQQAKPNAQILFDCHYYACVLGRTQGNRFGHVENYPYWSQASRNELYFLNQINIENDLRACLEYQNTLSLSAFIAPNIIVRRTLNSREGSIASSFINNTASVANQINGNRPVYATLALSREALLDTAELEQFVHLITALPNPPHGFYLLLALSGANNSELFHADIVTNLMYLVSSLKLNGFDVVMGYSDLVGPLLGVVGADAGCSGWFATLRMFSLNRFEPSGGGGKPPRPAYLSYKLFNRILVSELYPAYRLNVSVLNGFQFDQYYFDGQDIIEPSNKTEECLQSWEALQRLQNDFSQGGKRQRFNNLLTHLQDARALYESLRRQGLVFESKSSDKHLQAILLGLTNFQNNI